MSDLNPELTAAVAGALRDDSRIQALFGGPGAVRIWDVPPTDAPYPFLLLPGGAVDPIEAEGFDLSEIDFPVHVWSRPSQLGQEEARAFARVIRAILPTVRTVSAGRICAVSAVRTEPLLGDPVDPALIHAIVRATFTTAPA